MLFTSSYHRSDSVLGGLLGPYVVPPGYAHETVNGAKPSKRYSELYTLYTVHL